MTTALYPQPIASGAMDAAAMLIAYERPVEEIREELLSRGLSEYNAYLCYKAAMVLWKAGFYHQGGDS